MLSEREQFIVLVQSQRLRKADAIVLLTGDALVRTKKAATLFREHWAPLIVVSGNSFAPEHGSLNAHDYRNALLEDRVPETQILLEAKSLNTRQQGINIMEMVKKKGWKRIIIVASHYHQYRAFLTFLQARTDAQSNVDIINGWMRNLSWTRKEPYGIRIDLLEGEFDRIEQYQQKGDVASFKEGIDYLLDYDKKVYGTH